MKKPTRRLLLALIAPVLLLAGHAAGAADIKDRTLRFSFVQPKESHMGFGAQKFADLVAQKSGNKIALMLVIMLLVVVVGTAMDMIPTILILTPVLLPVVKSAGIDPIYFGVLFIINCAIGLITPPVGTVLNVVAGTSKISMDDLMKGVWPFLLAELVVLLLLVLFPALVTVPARWLAG